MMTVKRTESGSPDTRDLVDGYGRRISYLRVSITDRCNYRCRYCMPSCNVHFLPKSALLSFEELDRLCAAFIVRGTRALRLTGGEPLVRRDVMTFIGGLSRHLQTGALEEVTVTTNGSLLARFAPELVAAGMKRINVSLDTLDADTFGHVTTTGRLGTVLDGIDAALAAGLRLKINTVALKGVNDDEFAALARFAHGRGMDISFIETMPLGEVEMDRSAFYMPISAIREKLAEQFTLVPIAYRSQGPATYVELAETGGRVGFINPISHSFCDTCNKVRLSCTGVLYTCLGHDHSVDLGAIMRSTDDPQALNRAIDTALSAKPRGHSFVIEPKAAPALSRAMSVLGG